MIIKVCGMKHPQNIAQVAALSPDWMGFIFYARSPRYVGDLPPEIVRGIPSSILKVGVFVQETPAQMCKTADAFGLDFVQLHGGESVEDCQIVKDHGLGVIKVFSVGEDFDFTETEAFESVADYFLFDTKSPLYGGTGEQFDWQQLSEYGGKVPFMLGGGIGPADTAIASLLATFPQLAGIDLNSKFESNPGIKSLELLTPFIDTIRT